MKLFNLVILVLIQALTLNLWANNSSCSQLESSFSGQVYRVIKLPAQQKCLVQINFSVLNTSTACSLKLNQVEDQYIQMNGLKCDLKTDQSITGVISTQDGKLILNNRS